MTSEILWNLNQASASLDRALAHKWNYASVVTACRTCDGAGWVAASRRATVNDPYPENPCPDCDGEHEAECAVCGCTLDAEGFDCIACEFADMLPIDKIDDASLIKLADAIRRAVAVRRRFEMATEAQQAADHLAAMPADKRAALDAEWNS